MCAVDTDSVFCTLLTFSLHTRTVMCWNFWTVSVFYAQGDHSSGKWEKAGNVAEFNSCEGNLQEILGKILCKKHLLQTSHFGICQCLVASCMHICYALKYDVDNYNFVRSAVKSWGNVGGGGISQFLDSGHHSVKHQEWMVWVIDCCNKHWREHR